MEFRALVIVVNCPCIKGKVGSIMVNNKAIMAIFGAVFMPLSCLETTV